MKILLDTHAFLWFCQGDNRLSDAARTSIEDDANQLLLSAASVWEIAIKVSLEKLSLQKPFEILIPNLLSQNGIELLHLDMKHFFPLTCTRRYLI